MKRPALNSTDLLRFLRRHWFGLTIAVGVIVAVAAGYLIGERRFSDERVQALEKIETYRQVLTDASAKSKAKPDLEKRLQGLADHMLGANLETVDSEVRRRLNRACEELGLNDFSVTTGTSLERGTPAKKEFRQPEARALRDEADYREVQATVIASGPADRMYRLLYRIDAEPWMKRIEAIRLNPNNDGTSIRMTVRLTTPFMPGRSPSKPLALDPNQLQLADRYSALFGSNPFRIPPPPAPPPTVVATNPPATNKNGGATAAPTTPTPPPPVPVPPGGFPYGEWQITGIVEGPSGAEAWLRHVPSGATLALLPGTPVGELVFRGVEYDFAVFDSPSGPCRIQVGTNLTQRGAVAG